MNLVKHFHNHMPPQKTIPIQQAMAMNRHQRRLLGKQNGIKIISSKNLPKRKVNTQKSDRFFNGLFKNK